MVVQDTWFKDERGPDGKRTGEIVPSANHGKGLRYKVRWRGHSKSFAFKKVAERYEIKIKNQPHRPQTETVLIGDLIDRWLVTKKGLERRGYRACQDAASHVRKRWASRTVNSIDREEVQAWIDDIDGSPSQKHKLFQCLAGSIDLLGVPNPCREGKGVRLPRQTPREARFLELDELYQLADECDGYSPLIWMLGTTGLRIGEAVALNVGDVDKGRRRIRVRHPKNGEARDVPVSDFVLGMLDLKRPRTVPLFTSHRGTRILVDNWRARHFRPAAARAGLDDLTVHDLRHSAASLAIASGADVKAVQRMLGHKTATLTLDTYGHLWDRGLDDVARRLDTRIRGRSGADGVDDTP